MYNLSMSIPANLYYAANRLDAYLKDNMLCLENISRETCEDAVSGGMCGDKILFLCDGQNVMDWDTVRWIAGVMRHWDVLCGAGGKVWVQHWDSTG